MAYNLIQAHSLHLGNIGCCRTFLASDYVKAYPSTFIKALIAVAINCRVMDENIVSTIFLFNETKSL